MYDKSEKSTKKGVKFPVSIEARIAKQCKYDNCDKVRLKEGFYHVVPNVPYSKILQLVENKEKVAFYKNVKNAKRLLTDTESNNVREKREFSPTAAETVDLQETLSEKKRKLIDDRKEQAKVLDEIYKIENRGSKIIVLDRIKTLEGGSEALKEEIEALKEENKDLKKQMQEVKNSAVKKRKLEEGKDSVELKVKKRNVGSLRKYKTVAEAKEHDNSGIRKQYKKFARAVGEEMVKAVKNMKGGTEDVEGTVNAGLEYLLSQQPRKINDSQLHVFSALRNSIEENLRCENESQAISIASLAVHQMKDYSIKEITDYLNIKQYQVRKAIKHGKNSFPGAAVVKKKRLASPRVSWDRILSFCEFMADGNTSYDAPATKNNRDSKVTRILVNSKRKTCKLYTSYMESNFPSIKPISESYIMKYLNSSQFRRQRAQECCCTKCVIGHDAFNNFRFAVIKLHELAAELLNDHHMELEIAFKAIHERIKKLKEYMLGAGFSYGVTEQNVNPVHSIAYALSNPKDGECNRSQNATTIQSNVPSTHEIQWLPRDVIVICNKLLNVARKASNNVAIRQLEYQLFSVERVADNLFNIIGHLIRAVCCSNTKKQLISNLKSHQVFILSDYSSKIELKNI